MNSPIHYTTLGCKHAYRGIRRLMQDLCIHLIVVVGRKRLSLLSRNVILGLNWLSHFSCGNV